MSRVRSQQKDFLKFKKNVPQHQPLTEVNKEKQQRKQMRLNSLDAAKIKGSNDLVSMEKFGCVTPVVKLDRGIANRMPEENKRRFKFELKCMDDKCDKDDALSIVSYGGYSVKSKIGKVNHVIHNHRRINKQITYDFTQDEIPFINKALIESDESKNQKQDLNLNLFRAQKQIKNLSPFAYMFVNKKQNKHDQLKQILHDENRQKEQIDKYNLNCQKEMQNQKNQNQKNQSIYATKKPLKTINKMMDEKNDKFSSNLKTGDSKEQNEFLNEKGKIKTRHQQKQDELSDFEVSKQAEPINFNRYCFPCKIKFDNYKGHIETIEHKTKVKQALGNSYFLDQVQHFSDSTKQEVNSIEYKNLQQLADYLQKITESTQEFIFKKHDELKISLKQVADEIQKWLK